MSLGIGEERLKAGQMGGFSAQRKGSLVILPLPLRVQEKPRYLWRALLIGLRSLMNS